MNWMLWIKKNVWNILAFSFLLLMILSPKAKAWVLNKFLYTGIFNPSAKSKDSSHLKVPNLVFSDQTGRLVSLSQLEGKTVFINFWATWCPPCMAEMPTINNLYKQLNTDSSIVFMMVDVDNDPGKSISFMSKNNYSLPVYFTSNNIPSNLMDGSIPTTIIINKQGQIIRKIQGLTNYNTEIMAQLLKNQ